MFLGNTVFFSPHLENFAFCPSPPEKILKNNPWCACDTVVSWRTRGTSSGLLACDALLLCLSCQESVAEKLYSDMPDTSFTRTISNPEIVMKRRQYQKLSKKFAEIQAKNDQGQYSTRG